MAAGYLEDVFSPAAFRAAEGVSEHSVVDVLNSTGPRCRDSLSFPHPIFSLFHFRAYIYALGKVEKRKSTFPETLLEKWKSRKRSTNCAFSLTYTTIFRAENFTFPGHSGKVLFQKKWKSRKKSVNPVFSLIYKTAEIHFSRHSGKVEKSGKVNYF